MKETTPTSQAMLEAVYQELNYVEGSLIPSTSNPSDLDESEWVEKGDWLSLANRIDADRIFFVKNDPVIVFFESDSNDPDQLRRIFLKAWSMARPQCLFIALPGELKVYSLNTTPARNENEWAKLNPVALVQNIVDVAEKLQDYTRERIETGQVFAEERFGKLDNRADKRLIQDLKAVRQALINNGLSVRYTHSLIGRSIFIRYLEDRNIINGEYFREIANSNPSWSELLTAPLEKPNLTSDQSSCLYCRVLDDKDFTYALFRRLARDFNGDLFSTGVDEEEESATSNHLQLLKRFLLGDVDPIQPTLFFWAYDFSIIPIELISSIYEEFYHLGSKDDKGTHYTPSVLVEYVLSNLLTEGVLAENPRILDPACGSGIFLVETFRRIVRYKMKQKEASLSPGELRDILRNQIRGIEIDSEAIHIAAFSLYLALMHYQDPPAIQKNPRLPKLIADDSTAASEYDFEVLYNNNAFDLTETEREYIVEKLEAKPRFKGRAEHERLVNQSNTLPIDAHSCDIIVGNPPWGFVGRNAVIEIRQAQDQARRWCDIFDWSIGDSELSQAFIARSLKLLKPEGQAGMLVSSGVFFKQHSNSIHFRQRWLGETKVSRVVNFAHVRHLYFSAVSPFAFVQFEATRPHPAHRIQYWTARRTRRVSNTQSVVLGHTDLHRVNQTSLLNNDYLWKVYWWGGHQDAALIAALRLEKPLSELAKERQWITGRGFQGQVRDESQNYPSEWLKTYREFSVADFSRYGSITYNLLKDAPDTVHRKGNRDIYEGWRLLVKRGLAQAQGANGRIEARLEDQPYSFRNSVHGVRLHNTEDWERKILAGTIWSSIARYFFFMTASMWGFWHHELHLHEIMTLPIRFPQNAELQARIVEIVEALQHNGIADYFFDAQAQYETQRLENMLDAALFDLYELSDVERDLIWDMCEYGLDFLYRHDDGIAVSPVPHYPNTRVGILTDIERPRNEQRGLEGYLTAFLRIWNSELEPTGEFQWRVVRPRHVPMIAVIFTTQNKDEVLDETGINLIVDESEWEEVLRLCGDALQQEISRNIYIDGIVRAVTDTNIFIIKRDEMRLWTRSQARADAQATLLQAMQLQDAARG